MTIYLKQNLRYIRKSMGMTQDEFAAKTGMSRSVIGAYEEGRATPSLKRLVELSEMFGVSLDDLVLKDLENHCDVCEPASGFYLGTSCPKCHRPFRSTKVTETAPPIQ